MRENESRDDWLYNVVLCVQGVIANLREEVHVMSKDKDNMVSLYQEAVSKLKSTQDELLVMCLFVCLFVPPLDSYERAWFSFVCRGKSTTEKRRKKRSWS